MEIRQIQSFIMITQEGSFSKAAEILGYSSLRLPYRFVFWRMSWDLSCLTVSASGFL